MRIGRVLSTLLLLANFAVPARAADPVTANAAKPPALPVTPYDFIGV